jgi:hypothetical protein
MSETAESNNERPCLHCLIGDLIDEFYEEFGSQAGEPATIDSGELLCALAKTFAELTYGSDKTQRQNIMQEFLHDVAKFEAAFQAANLNETLTSDARH